MRFETHPEADDEFLDAIAYYQRIDQALSLDLIREFESEVQLISANPFIYRLRLNGFHRANLDRFPYYLPFLVKADTIHLLAFAHHSRRPNYWIHRTSL